MNPELLINKHCACGENPLWDDQRNLLYWTDIPNGKIWAFDHQNQTHRQIYDGPECGAFLLQSDGSLLLLRTDEMARLDLETGEVLSLQSGFATGFARFNDCLADPKGRVFSGTMGNNGKNDGALFRIDWGGKLTQICGETACSNGMAFSLDGKHLFWSDTTNQTVFCFDYDEETGELTNRRAWLETENRPDGLTIDSVGNLWIAFWDLGVLRLYSRDAKWLETVDFPSRHVTAPAFGGPNWDELYVTTAGGGKPDSGELDGALFRLKPAIGGSPEHRSRILLDK